MAFSDALKRIQGRSLNAGVGSPNSLADADTIFGPQIQTQLGNPNFSIGREPSSQALFPAAAAEQRLFENQRRSQNLLIKNQRAGFDVSGDEFDPIREGASGGFLNEALTLGETLVGWLDGPRQAVNLLIQDILGGEAETGFKNPNIGDYFNAVFGGIEDEEGFELQTGLNPTSGSKTLDMFGWGSVAEEDAAFGSRVGRGAAHFLFDVAIDPLTYVTFGLAGLGKKVASATGKLFVDDVVKWTLPKVKAGTLESAISALPEGNYLREIGSNLDVIEREFTEKLEKMTIDEGGALSRETFDSMKRQLTEDAEGPFAQLELAIRQRVGKDVLKPLVARDFAAIPESALELLPKFAHGGARISVPFTGGRVSSFLEPNDVIKVKRQSGTLQAGFVIPGSRGAGRKLTNPLRDISNRLRNTSSKYNGLADIFEEATSKLDIDRGILRALKDGTIEPWQYQIVAGAMDSISDLSHVEDIAARLNSHLSDVETLIEGTEFDTGQIFRAVFDELENVNPDDELLRAFEGVFGMDAAKLGKKGILDVHPDISNKVTQIAEDVHDIMSDHIRVLTSLNPKIKKELFEGRMPHLITPEGGALLARIYNNGGGARPQGAGDELVAIYLDAISAGGRLEDQIGASKMARATVNNAESQVAALALLDDGLILMKDSSLELIENKYKKVLTGFEVDESALAEGRMSASQLNDMMKSSLERLAQERNIPLPKNWDGKILNENPLDVTLSFVRDTQQAAQGLRMVNALKSVGLAVDAKTNLDVQDILLTTNDRLVANSDIVINPNLIPNPDQKTAPTSFLSKFIKGVGGTGQSDASFGRLTGDTARVSRNNFDTDIAKRGIKEPVNMEIANDGTMLLADGSHRVDSAQRLGIGEVPIIYERVNVDSFGGEHFRDFLNDVEVGTKGGADKFFKANPWQPQALEDKVAILRGSQGIVDVIPSGVARSAKRTGLTIGGRNTEDARQLYDLIRNNSQAEFLAKRRIDKTNQATTLWRSFKDDLPQRGPRGGWGSSVINDVTTHTYYGKNGKPLMFLRASSDELRPINLVWGADPTIGKELRDALDGASRVLDQEFLEGSLKGKLSFKNIDQILREQDISDHGARALYRYLNNKVGAMSPELKEFLNESASEFEESRVLFDSFDDQITDMFETYAGGFRVGDDGVLVVDENALKTLGDDAFTQSVLELKKTAGMLSANGHEVAARVMRGLDEKFAAAEVTEGFVNPKLFQLGGAVDDLRVQQDMANWMRQLTKNANTIYTPAGVTALKHGVNESLKWWRAMATIARPAFHIRNMVGATWNNMIVGVGPEDYKLVANNALKMRKAFRAGKTFEEALDVLPKDVRPYFEAGWKNDIMSGFSSTEFRQLPNKAKREILDWAKVWDVDDFALTRIGAKFMESIEDFQRMAAFVRWYDPLDPSTAKVAKEMVEAVHFNYTRLTPMETKIKQLVPFFVWQRRNLPLQVQQLVENPRMIQRYRHMMDAISENFGGNEEGLPPGDNFTAYAAGTKYTVNPDTPFWARVIIDPDLPVRDLVDMPWPTPPGLVEFANQLVGPHVSTIFDINQEREFGDVNAPAPFNAVLRSLAAVGLYDTTTDGDVRIPYYARSVTETALPFLRETVEPLTGGPTDPNRRQRQGISPDDSPFEAAAKSLMSTFARGLGFKFSTPADVRSSAARSREEIDQLVRELRLQGRAVPSDAP